MKTLQTKIIPYLLLLVTYNLSSAQNLFIDGRFFDSSEKMISAEFRLVSNQGIIKAGLKRKIKFKLSLNTEYTLIISKKGFYTRSIKFSPNKRLGKNFTFAFDVTLHKIESQKKVSNISELAFVNVYYDYQINRFNYCFIKKNQPNY